MKKIISFSLYGNKPNFQVGAVVNVLEAKRLYPDWKCRFYTTDDEGICKQLEYLGAEIVRMDDWPEGQMFWRFLAVDDADVCLSRDTDSVVNEREVGAVNEWLESDYQWHGMHDHSYHRSVSIMGGMWGFRHYEDKIPESVVQQDAYIFDFHNVKSMKQHIEEWVGEGHTTIGRNCDQKFLGYLYENKAQTNIMWHGSWVNATGNPFPSHAPCRYGNFVGDYSFWAGGWKGCVQGDQDVFNQYKLNKEAKDVDLPQVICVYHNLGLGDHIVMNGPIRHMLHNYNIKELRLICKESNYNNVAYMYRDEPRIKVITICDQPNLRKEWGGVRWRKGREDAITETASVLTIHHDTGTFPNFKHCPTCNSSEKTISFKGEGCRFVCLQDSIQKSFYVQRDEQTEDIAMERILSANGLKVGDEYVFACFDCSGGRIKDMIEKIKLKTDKPIVLAEKSPEYKIQSSAPGPNYSGVIFEWMKLIENASEIHTIDTSFFHLIQGMSIDDVPKFFWEVGSRNTRSCTVRHYPMDDWEII